MPRSVLALLFLVPAIACAECGFSVADDTMTIVVGKNTRKCFSSAAFKEAFKADVADATRPTGSELSRPQRKKAFDERGAKGDKLWALEERAFQARAPSGRYFGQRQ
jgi:hypothetical protein